MIQKRAGGVLMVGGVVGVVGGWPLGGGVEWGGVGRDGVRWGVQ